MIVDFHAHCLPHMDDGAADVATAVNMLTEAGRQGVFTVVATPHFYLGQETAASFLERRQATRDALLPHLPADAPHLVMGAEVLMREGVSRLNLQPLCIEGTNCLLAELPFMQPPHWLYEELENIVYGQRLTLILAHVDRYMPWYSSNRIAKMMDFPDLIVQLNGESLSNRQIYRRLQRWLPDTNRLLLGSDMHNTEDRPPNLEQAVRTLGRHRRGRQWLERVENTIRTLR